MSPAVLSWPPRLTMTRIDDRAARCRSGCPFSRHLPGRGVEAVPDVDQRDLEDQCRTRRLVVVLGNLVPYIIGHRVCSITEPGDSFGERQGGAFRVAKVGRVSP